MRRVVTGVVTAIGIALAAACAPPPTTTTFVVTSAADRGDALVGDDVCEATPGAGDCTLRAAVEEAGALAEDVRAVVSLPSGVFPVGAGLALEPGGGWITISAPQPGARIVGSGGTVLDVVTGRAVLVGVGVHGGDTGVAVASGARVDLATASVSGAAGDGVVVAAGGEAVLTNSTVAGNGGDGVATAGPVAGSFLTVTDNGTGGVTGAGTVTLSASVVADQAGGPDCAAAVVSTGWNLDGDGSCGLSEPSDLSGVAADLGHAPAAALDARPPLGASPARDSVPAGSGPCTDGAVDQTGAARPVAGACDRGAVEAAAGLDLVVSAPGDTLDAAPGDGSCADAAGACTLRAALGEVAAWGSGDHRIRLATDVTLSRAGAGEDAGATGDLDVAGTVTIDGGGHRISASGIDRVLDVRPGAVVSVVDAALGGGLVSGDGGGVRVAGELRTDSVAVSGSTASGAGGAVAVTGSLDATASTFDSSAGSALRVTGAAHLRYVTVWGATTAIDATGGSVVVGAGAIDAAPPSACAGGVASEGWTVADASCGLGAAGDVVADPGLGPLVGGPTPARHPRTGSPTIDRVPASTPGWCDGGTGADQHGVARPRGAGCDAGALEVVGGALVVDTAVDGVDAAPGDGTCAVAGGGCSLRAAVQESNATPGAAVVVVSPAVGSTLPLSSTAVEDAGAAGDLDVHDDLVLVGSGVSIDVGSGLGGLDVFAPADVAVVGVSVRSGGVPVGSSEIGVHHRGGTLAMSDLAVTGFAGSGVRTDAGDLRLDRVTLALNASDGWKSRGGGLYVLGGHADVHDSTIVGNTANFGGGVAVDSTGSLSLVQSTVTANATLTAGVMCGPTGCTTGPMENDGGGVRSESNDLDVTASTLSGNTPNDLARSAGSQSTVAGSIVGRCNGVGSGTGSGGHNLEPGVTCGFSQPSDRVGAPVLAGFASNGGPTLTALPAAGSDGVDAIPAGTAGLCDAAGRDQRGLPRQDGPACDIGAVEGVGAPVAALHLLVDSAVDAPDATPGDGVCATAAAACSFRAAVAEANARPTADVIEVLPSAGPVLAVPSPGASGGGLTVSGLLTVEGSGSTLDAQGASRVLRVDGGALELRDLGVRGGDAAAGAGGGVYATDALLRLVAVDVHGNRAGYGGGVLTDDGRLEVERSMIRDNAAAVRGGAVSPGSPATFDRTLVTGNVAGTGAAVWSGPTDSLTLRSVTIARNVSLSGAAVDATGTRQLTASLVDNPGPDCAVAVTSGGWNVGGDSSCGLTSATDHQGADPRIGQLASGEVAPHTDSAAVDLVPAGTPGLCGGGVDVRGGPRRVGAGCDAGAVEGTTGATPGAAATWVVDTAADAADAAPGDGVCAVAGGGCTLRAAVDEANAAPTPDTIDLGGLRPVLSLPGHDENGNRTGDLDLWGPVTLTGGVADGGGVDRVVDSFAPTDLVAVTVTGGAAPDTGGGVRHHVGTLELVSTSLLGNAAPDGAALDVAGGDAVTRFTTIAANVPGAGGSSLRAVAPLAATATAVTGPEADCDVAAVTSSGWNADSDGTCGFTTPTDTTAALGLSAPSGHPLVAVAQSGSPLLDAIPAGTPGVCDAGAPADQLGAARPVGAGCDVGAVDVAGPPLPSFVVTTAADAVDAAPGDGTCATAGGACTLRAAVQEADAVVGWATVTIPAGIDPTLSIAGAGDDAGATGDLDVHDPLVLVGAGVAETSVSAATLDRVVDVHGTTLVAHDLVLTAGRAAAGGGLRAQSASLQLSDLAVTSSASTGDGGALHLTATPTVLERVRFESNTASGKGGAVMSDSALTLTDSLLRSNTAATRGGGVAGTSVTVTGSTFDRNRATSGVGGGVDAAQLTVGQSTFDGNSAPFGGSALAASTSATVEWSTFAGNQGLHVLSGPTTLRGVAVATTGGGRACGAPATSAGGNVIGDPSCAVASGSDVEGVNPVLAPLADNGGPTPTRLPAANSATTDRVATGMGGCDASAPVDQRGVVRPAGSGCDAGAVEGTGPAIAPGSFTVTVATDAVDAAPGNGVCATAGGQCTLRAAVMEANARPTADTVTVAPGVDPLLSRAGRNEELAATGDLDVVDHLTLRGSGATTVSAAGIDRVLHARSGTLTVEDLTLTGGSASGGIFGNHGGAVLSETELVLRRVVVTTSTAKAPGAGGGVAVLGPASPVHPDVVIEDSTITANGFVAGGPSDTLTGGGIYLRDADLSMQGSHVTDNDASGHGGGIAQERTLALPGVTFVVDGSEISGNGAVGDGGGLWAADSVAVLTATTVAGNTSGAAGGGVRSTVDMTGSTVSGNSAVDGGGVRGAGTVTSSTLSGNSASSGGGLSGNFTISASTLSGNQATASGGGWLGAGSVSASTFSANTATGAGAQVWASGNLTITATTVTGATAVPALARAPGAVVTVRGSALEAAGAPVCASTVVSTGWNVVADTSCGVAQVGDLQGAALLLGALGPNGGPTATHVPGPGSPLLDRIPLGTVGLCEGTDQRGVARPQGGTCEAGSVEN